MGTEQRHERRPRLLAHHLLLNLQRPTLGQELEHLKPAPPTRRLVAPQKERGLQCHVILGLLPPVVEIEGQESDRVEELAVAPPYRHLLGQLATGPNERRGALGRFQPDDPLQFLAGLLEPPAHLALLDEAPGSREIIGVGRDGLAVAGLDLGPTPQKRGRHHREPVLGGALEGQHRAVPSRTGIPIELPLHLQPQQPQIGRRGLRGSHDRPPNHRFRLLRPAAAGEETGVPEQLLRVLRLVLRQRGRKPDRLIIPAGGREKIGADPVNGRAPELAERRDHRRRLVESARCHEHDDETTAGERKGLATADRAAQIPDRGAPVSLELGDRRHEARRGVPVGAFRDRLIEELARLGECLLLGLRQRIAVADGQTCGPNLDDPLNGPGDATDRRFAPEPSPDRRGLLGDRLRVVALRADIKKQHLEANVVGIVSQN